MRNLNKVSIKNNISLSNHESSIDHIKFPAIIKLKFYDINDDVITILNCFVTNA